MKASLWVPLTLIALATLVAAQDHRGMPPASLKPSDATGVLPATDSRANEPAAHSNGKLPFCPPKTCLYYSGDFDSNNPHSNGLFNLGNGGGFWEVFVGVKPTESVVVTGATFNELSSNSQVGLNSTPFGVNVNMSSGNGGTFWCSTHGTVTMAAYGESYYGYTQYSYTIKKLSKACKLKKGTVYFVTLVPEYTDGSTIAYLLDVEDKPAPNHRGWKNVLDDSFYLAPAFGAEYEPTWGNSGACNGIGCDGFSIALTGKKTQ